MPTFKFAPKQKAEKMKMKRIRVGLLYTCRMPLLKFDQFYNIPTLGTARPNYKTQKRSCFPFYANVGSDEVIISPGKSMLNPENRALKIIRMRTLNNKNTSLAYRGRCPAPDTLPFEGEIGKGTSK